jgi:hypothetical protein
MARLDNPYWLDEPVEKDGRTRREIILSSKALTAFIASVNGFISHRRKTTMIKVHHEVGINGDALPEKSYADALEIVRLQRFEWNKSRESGMQKGVWVCLGSYDGNSINKRANLEMDFEGSEIAIQDAEEIYRMLSDFVWHNLTEFHLPHISNIDWRVIGYLFNVIMLICGVDAICHPTDEPAIIKTAFVVKNPIGTISNIRIVTSPPGPYNNSRWPLNWKNTALSQI